VVDAGVGVLLRDLTDPAGAVLTPTHAGCPGHAARIDRAWGRVDRVTGLPAATPDTASPDDEKEEDDADLENDEEYEEYEEYEDEDDEEDESADDGTVWAKYPASAWVCTDPDTHGRTRRLVFPTRRACPGHAGGDDPAQSDAARAERRDAIESNKA